MLAISEQARFGSCNWDLSLCLGFDIRISDFIRWYLGASKSLFRSHAPLFLPRDRLNCVDASLPLYSWGHRSNMRARLWERRRSAEFHATKHLAI
jgi:hypothetical protein